LGADLGRVRRERAADSLDWPVALLRGGPKPGLLMTMTKMMITRPGAVRVDAIV
jgi:hypothetical protein